MDRPNVLLLITDQQQAATVACDSICQTPNLDQIAAEGVRFDRAYTVNAICSPTRASLFTGMLPNTHGMVDCTHTVNDYRAKFQQGLTLWSQQLENLGYQTGYFGKWHVERRNRLNEFGFQTHELHGSSNYKQYVKGLGLRPQSERFIERYNIQQPGYKDCQLYGVIDGTEEETSEHYLYSRCIEFIEQKNSNSPWCLTVSTTAPHDPYFALNSYYDWYDPDQIPQPTSFTDPMKDIPNIYRRMREIWDGMSWQNFAEATACYYAICTMIDAQVGRLIQILKDTDQYDNTIILFLSDHGDYMGAHRMMMKGVAAFEEAYRIPFILRTPDQPANGTVNKNLVSVIDVGPTLLDAVDAEPLPDSEGTPLLPLLQKDQDEWVDEAFAEFHGQRFFFTQRIIWRDHFKYIFNGFDYDELYDLKANPNEQRNLAKDNTYANLRDELANRMWQRMHQTDDHNMINSHYGTLRFAPVGPYSGLC